MRKEKRNTKMRYLLAVLLAAVCFFCAAKTDAQASASKAEFHYKKADKSKKYKNCNAQIYYKRVVLDGDSAAIKKINKALKEDMDSFLSSDNVDLIKQYAKTETISGSEYYYTATSKVTYNKKGIISVRVMTDWYAGGTGNTNVYGFTYSLKTGKKLSLVNVCSGSASKIKKRVIKEIKKDADSAYMYWDVINAYSVKDMQFYLKENNKAVVCFGPYEIGSGGGYRSFTIKSKYK